MIVGMTVAVKSPEGCQTERVIYAANPMMVKLQTLRIVRHGATLLVPALRR